MPTTSSKPILYRSTRGGVEDLTFEQAVFEGLAPDGGLLVPQEVPDVLSVFKDWKTLPYHELAYEIMSLFCDERTMPSADLRKLMKRSYESTFSHEQVAPTVPLGDMHVLELFHGPTFAFKDFALQALGNLYEYFLARRGDRLTVLGATSGDTGSAAIYGLRGKAGVECFILFPEGRVSAVQQRQMTGVLDSNVHCIAVNGTFDDCQDIVKELFGDLDFKRKHTLGAVNSINWARIAFQITYYFHSYFQLFPNCDGEVSFSVPTGNFGDVLAGYYAKRMGLPVKTLVVATNSNDILHRFFTSGQYVKHNVAQTCSPSMDIGISSNFERYLFYLFDSDGAKLGDAMRNFKATGELRVDADAHAAARRDFASARANETEIQETIKTYYQKHGYVLDPHTACGVYAADALRGELGWSASPKHAMVVLGTAHPAKFHEDVSSAIGTEVTLPHALAAQVGAKTRCVSMPNSAESVREAIEAQASLRAMAEGYSAEMPLQPEFRAILACKKK